VFKTVCQWPSVLKPIGFLDLISGITELESWQYVWRNLPFYSLPRCFSYLLKLKVLYSVLCSQQNSVKFQTGSLLICSHACHVKYLSHYFWLGYIYISKKGYIDCTV
jgi:hypothetical protein